MKPPEAKAARRRSKSVEGPTGTRKAARVDATASDGNIKFAQLLITQLRATEVHPVSPPDGVLPANISNQELLEHILRQTGADEGRSAQADPAKESQRSVAYKYGLTLTGSPAHDRPAQPVAPAVGRDLAPKSLPYHEALQYADWFYEALNAPEIGVRLVKAFGEELFTGEDWAEPKEESPTVQDLTWRHRWRDDRPCAFAVGLQRLVDMGDEEPRYKLQVRLQSSRRIMPRILTAIRDELRETFSRLISVRWSAPVILLPEARHGDDSLWHVKPNGRFHVGAPINISGGAAGSMTLLFKKDRQFLGLTSGHALVNTGDGRVGAAVYSPTRFDDRSGTPIGTIYDLRGLPGLSLTARRQIFQSDNNDFPHEFALVDMDYFRLPMLEQHRRIGLSYFQPQLYTAKMDTGLPVQKVAARTRAASGIVTASDFRLEAWDPLCLRSVYAQGLVEIQLEERYEALAGDSGALLTTSVNGIVQPAAQLMGGVRAAALETSDKRQHNVIYGIPLMSIAAISGMEVA